MSIIKAYHSCNEIAYKDILDTAMIKRTVDLKGISCKEFLWGTTTEQCIRLDHYFTYFAPIRPFLGRHFGNHGFVFDSEVLIREFDACLTFDTLYQLESLSRVDIKRYYLDRAKFLRKFHGIKVPKVGALYGDDALNLLRQIEKRIGLLCRPVKQGTPDRAAADFEFQLLSVLELRCPVGVPLNKAYSHYANVPDFRWNNPLLRWSSDEGRQVTPNEVLHHSLWQERGYEIRLNQ